MNKPIYIKMSENKFCNKSYYNEYIDTAFLKQKNISINVYTKNQFIQDISQINLLKLFSNSYNCRIISKEISKDLKREVYLDDRFQSTFLIILKRIYSWLK